MLVTHVLQFGICIWSIVVRGTWDNPCLSSSNMNKLFCDESKTFEERAHDLVYNQIGALSNAAEAYQNLSGNNAKAVPALKIPAYEWWNEALHGICCKHGESCNGAVNSTTMFPEPITTASSFNQSLFYEIGNAISTEGRAMYNVNQSDLTYWAPNINIFRDPRWGRGQETPGEDPFVNSVYATNFIRGMQGYYDNVKYLKSSSCCKHFADYNLEDADGVTRHTFNAIVSDYDQNDTYLVAFKYCVVGGNASGIMCSYNAENGIPSCANKALLTDYLRDGLGFYGYITGDCGAVSNVESTHHYTNTSGATINAVYSAGLDLDCGSFTQSHLAAAVNDKDAKLSDIQRGIYDAALVQMRLGLFDQTNVSTNPYDKYGPTDVCTKSHLDLSLEAALQSIVLLKNENSVLPLNKNDYKTIALIGPNANGTNVMQGNYHGQPPFTYSMYDGLNSYYTDADITFSLGCQIAGNNRTGFAAAIAAAKSADVTVLVMGIDQSQEGEGHDRTSIALPGVQNELIGNISENSQGPIILVVLSGGCVDISLWRDSDKISSIVWGGYPGMYGGLAIAKILFGDHNPSARLTQTWYYAHYTSEMLMTNMNMRPNKSTNSVGRGYRYYAGNVVYQFGDGLSYTTFSCLKVIVNSDNDMVNVTVTNDGKVDGSAVVLIYFIPKNAGNDGIPIKRLVAFGRIHNLETSDSDNLTMDIYKEFVDSEEQINGGQYVAGGACQ